MNRWKMMPLPKQGRSLGWRSFGEELIWLKVEARNAMQFQSVRINMRYERADLREILRYAKAHDVERSGRYDCLRLPPLLNIWTHAWINAGCKAESCVMFSVEVDWKNASLMFVVLMRGFDWEAFMDELATLEIAALGKSIFGRTQREPTI